MKLILISYYNSEVISNGILIMIFIDKHTIIYNTKS
jgi:hypothetical protein